MFPFHKIYLRLFSSLDFDIEKKLLSDLKSEWVTQFLSIKRSWIYALKISSIALLGAFFLFSNALIALNYFDGVFWSIVLPISYIVLWMVILYDTFWYLWSYRTTHWENTIEDDIDTLIKRNYVVNKNFIRFFNISVFVSLFLIVTLLETLVFSIFFYDGDNISFILLEIFFNIFAGICIFKHRRLSMNLELDFWLVVPWKVYVIDQTWLLSSKQSIVAQNIKTIEWAYRSIFSSLFSYGDIKIFLEWNIPQEKGIVTLDYAKDPRNTVDLINKVL